MNADSIDLATGLVSRDHVYNGGSPIPKAEKRRRGSVGGGRVFAARQDGGENQAAASDAGVADREYAAEYAVEAISLDCTRDRSVRDAQSPELFA